jgi:CRISPR-associated protein Csb2
MMQALVAGVCTGGYREMWPRVEQGFRWLERRPAPSILTRPARDLRRYRIAVPNNDLDVVAREWAAGRQADPAKIRTMKEVASRLVDAAEPHVRFVWALKEDEDADAVAAMLRPISHCLYSLGWGVDMAYADVEVGPGTDEDGWERWAPSTASGTHLAVPVPGFIEALPVSAMRSPKFTHLAVPVPGFIEDLQSTYVRFTARAAGIGADTDTRPTLYRFQRYARQDAVGAPWIAFDLIALDGRPKGWHAAMEVAAWMRHAAAEALRNESFGEDLNGFVLGHGSDGSVASHRMSFVPLPSIGHLHADGRIRRVMFTEPVGGTGRSLELLNAKLPGITLSSEDGREVCSLTPPTITRVTGFYTAPARTWRSVTPVILHGHNSVRGTVSVAKTERLLLRAFEMAGFSPDIIERLAFQPAPLWSGTGGAGAIRVPQHLRKNNYPRYHVEVRFRHTVTGPVLAGIGRHYGIGVLATPDPPH